MGTRRSSGSAPRNLVRSSDSSPHELQLVCSRRPFEGEEGSLEHRIWLTKKKAGSWLGAKARRHHSQELSPTTLEKCLTEQGPDVLKPLNGERALLDFIQNNQATLGSLSSVADWQAVVNYETWSDVLTDEERALLQVPGMWWHHLWPEARECWTSQAEVSEVDQTEAGMSQLLK